MSRAKKKEKSSLLKYKSIIAQYEDEEYSLSPLTRAQMKFIDEFNANYRDKKYDKVGLDLEDLSPISNEYYRKSYDITQEFKSKNEFRDWFLDVEKDIEEELDEAVSNYVAQLVVCEREASEILVKVSAGLQRLKNLQENYHAVANKTNSLHTSCQQLIEEKERLEKMAVEIKSNLNSFLMLERIGTKLNSPHLIIGSDSFFSLLQDIDSCLDFLNRNPNFKESAVYSAKYKQCLNKAVSLIKSHTRSLLQEITSGIIFSVIATQQCDNNSTDSSENTPIFPLIYGNFSAGVSKLKKLFGQIEERRQVNEEYKELFSDLQEAFFKERSTLLKGSVSGTVGELSRRGGLGVDLCNTVRYGIRFCLSLCTDEYRLFSDFFLPSYTLLFDDFIDTLYIPIFDTLRPLIIKIQHLETLAELCTILKFEILEDQTTANLGLNAFISLVNQLLQDTQERLVYRASIYISTDIQNYNPGPGDLAYPEKLIMMEEIAEKLELENERPLVRSNSQSSIVSLSSITSMEVAHINNSSQIIIPRPLKSASSPADLHGMWFPTVRRTLLCLSKLYRCLDKSIFQGLSQEALTACISNLTPAAQAISAKKTVLDGHLFEIKHLLILREQIAPFQVEFAVKEMSLDFSSVKVAALSLLQKKKQLFSLGSNNSLLEFIVEGTPQVREYFLDSKKEVDSHLKDTCEKFITHSTNILIGPLQTFLSKANKVIEASKEKNEIKLSCQSFSLPENVSEVVRKTVESLQSKLGFIHKSMRLYLANPETEFILFRPVKNNILNAFLELESMVSLHYDSPISVPSQDHLSALISSLMLQSSNST